MAKEALKGKIYKCPSCGSTLCFDPASQRLKCTHCNSLQELVAPRDAFEITYSASSEDSYAPWGDAKTVKCRSCGAEFVTAEFETALSCPFCGTSNVLRTDDIPGLKPNAILPFKITEEVAKEAFRKWLGKRSMSPHGLKKIAEQKHMQGIYVPIFTFDSDTFSTYHIKYGIHRTIVVGSGKDAKTVVVTDWYTDSGMYSDSFDDIQVEVSQFLTQKNLHKIGGFDSQNAFEYNSQYIAGFSAERYSTGLDDSWNYARAEIDSSIKRSILSRYNYDELGYVNISTTYSNRRYKYLLAPIWSLVYNYKGKEYCCIVNGRTGQADGKAPLSPIKVAIVSIASAAVLAGIIYLIYKFFIQ